MSKRYFISSIIVTVEEGFFVPKMYQYLKNLPLVAIALDQDENSPTFGQLLFPTGFVVADVPVNYVAISDPDVYQLPDFPVDGKVSSIADSVRSAMWTELTARYFDITGLDQIDSYRDLLIALGSQRQQGFMLPLIG